MRIVDISGQVFGTWRVDTLAPSRGKFGKALWECQCTVCGIKRTLAGVSLRRGELKNCVHNLRAEKSAVLVGEVFGLWTVLSEPVKKTLGKQPHRFCVCRCVCGTVKDVMVNTLLSGTSKSCGCFGHPGGQPVRTAQVLDGDCKLCSRCGRKLPLVLFNRQKNLSSGFDSNCRVCTANRAIGKQHTLSPEIVRKNIALTFSRLEAQNGVCPGCNGPYENSWVVEHDHTTGMVRGVMCRMCNTALGAAKDSPATLQNLAAYLTKKLHG
jgi:hypothetical protein